MQVSKNHTPELLLPVGNIEAFWAALEGGADAIYFGLKNFNARNRALNFSPWQAAAMVQEARKRNVKSYLTLNTVIRNFDLPELIHTLYQIKQIQPHALIVQDWGILFLIQKYFPELSVHASTQMGIHNSAGTEHAGRSGIRRVVLARELTLPEVKAITTKSPIETELFVHGALCYSFSGMCLFSSYLGGAGANRGLCTQPCRRIYTQKTDTEKKSAYFFSLKDHQLVDQLDELKKLRIASLKVEGRMKPGEYVFRVARAYRMALDHPEKREEARAILSDDLGREKTGYFLGRDVSEAITHAATSGILLGKVVDAAGDTITFRCNRTLEPGCRLRFRNPQNDKLVEIKAENIVQNEEGCSVTGDPKEIKQTYEVYLAGNKLRLPQRISTQGITIREHGPAEKTKSLINSLRSKEKPNKRELFIRIGTTEWLDHLRFVEADGYILKLSAKEWRSLPGQTKLLNTFPGKLHFELPAFISEKKQPFYEEMASHLSRKGFTSFFVSHLSQKLLLPPGSSISSTENVYAFNDAAIRFLNQEGMRMFVYPFENDIANLAKGNNRNGIVPIFFHPTLFSSRMPVDVKKAIPFSDRNGEKYTKRVQDGLTLVVPEKPVSLTQYREKLERFGFLRFLIDLSFTAPDREKLLHIHQAFRNSETIPGSSLFNFKREMK